jgi:hypothetical protein
MAIRGLITIPTAPETAIWRAIVGVLRGDPVLMAVRSREGNLPVTVRAWEGDPDKDVADPSAGGNEPSASELPLIRMTPQSYPQRWLTEQQHSGEWTLRFDVYTPGTNIDDYTDLCGVIRGAYFPTDPTQKAIVKAALSGSNLIRPTFRGFGPSGLLGQTRYGLKGAATLTVALQVNTW